MLQHSFIRYCVVGLINTCVGLGSIYAGMRFLGLGYVSANALGYCIGILTSFALNRSWTFGGGSSRSTAQFLRFLCVLAVAYPANLLTVAALLPEFPRGAIIPQALGMIPYVLIGYLGNRYFAFAHSNASIERDRSSTPSPVTDP